MTSEHLASSEPHIGTPSPKSGSITEGSAFKRRREDCHEVLPSGYGIDDISYRHLHGRALEPFIKNGGSVHEAPSPPEELMVAHACWRTGCQFL